MHGKVEFEFQIDANNNHEVFYICQLDNVSLCVSLCVSFLYFHHARSVAVVTIKMNPHTKLRKFDFTFHRSTNTNHFHRISCSKSEYLCAHPFHPTLFRMPSRRSICFLSAISLASSATSTILIARRTFELTESPSICSNLAQHSSSIHKVFCLPMVPVT